MSPRNHRNFHEILQLKKKVNFSLLYCRSLINDLRSLYTVRKANTHTKKKLAIQLLYCLSLLTPLCSHFLLLLDGLT